MTPTFDPSVGGDDAPDHAAPPFALDDRLPASRDLIAGRRCVPGLVLDGTLDDPNTGLPLAPRCATRPEDVDRALAAAHAVHEQGSWAAAGVEGRAEVLLRLADELTARTESMALAESLNTGIVLGVTTAIAGGCADQVRGLVEQLRSAGTVTELPGRGRGGPVRLHRDPWGPAVVAGAVERPLTHGGRHVGSGAGRGLPGHPQAQRVGAGQQRPVRRGRGRRRRAQRRVPTGAR